MSQFAMMIPIQGSGASQKTAGTTQLQTSGESDAMGLSFSKTLENLAETNPNGAALLLALQQMGMLSNTPAIPQASGSLLPQIGELGGKPLPLPDTVQLNSLQSLPLQDADLLNPQQMLPTMAGKMLKVDSAQVLAVAGLVGGEASQSLDVRGLGDFNNQLFGLGMGSQTSLTSVNAKPMITLPLQVPVGQAGWDSAVGERIQWMVSRQVQSAEIKLTPPDLGPLEIKLSVQNDQTNVSFVASHAATRDALEAAIPRLREMFGEMNLNLANVDVSQQQAGESHAKNGEASGESDHYQEGSDGEAWEPDRHVVRMQSQGMVDTYA
ncbi:MAG: flagellar hook-length control protein FliK [Candidatus Thiodiazotropha sp. (ex Myrtea spinifera)]|nr:flagellar hook-length control protein FliK [Candidatus Thiodiazotropha sp. (ex Myrtea spinifera)]MCU7827532.1 flagellar hook-length control protein FliK [Candidatus Thiodiazotropha sp. (ex Myrtea sp. 'scaly one' KF741663)]